MQGGHRRQQKATASLGRKYTMVGPSYDCKKTWHGTARHGTGQDSTISCPDSLPLGAHAAGRRLTAQKRYPTAAMFWSLSHAQKKAKMSGDCNSCLDKDRNSCLAMPRLGTKITTSLTLGPASTASTAQRFKNLASPARKGDITCKNASAHPQSPWENAKKTTDLD